MARSSRRRTRTVASPALEAKYVAACAAVHSGTCKNLATAAKTFGLPYHTLRRRYRHHSSSPSSSPACSQDAPLLSDAQERALCDRIRFPADANPPSMRSIRVAASELSTALAAETRRTGKIALAPRAWVDAFFARHPDLADVPVPPDDDEDEDAVSTGTGTDSGDDVSVHSEDAEGVEDTEALPCAEELDGGVRPASATVAAAASAGPEGTPPLQGLPVQPEDGVVGRRRNPFRASRVLAVTVAPVVPAAPSRRKTRAPGTHGPQELDLKRLVEAETRVGRLEEENRRLTDLRNAVQERCDRANQRAEALQTRVNELEVELEVRDALERQREEESMKALCVRHENPPYDHNSLDRDVGLSASHPLRTDMNDVAPNGHHLPAEPLPYFVHNAPYYYLPAHTQGHPNMYQYYYPYGVPYAHVPYHT